MVLKSLAFAPSPGTYVVRDPSHAEVSIPDNIQPQFNIQGFFLPVTAVDDIEMVWQFRWEMLRKAEVDALTDAQYAGLLALEDPLGLPVRGYVENFDFRGVRGRVDAETGEALYQGQCEFRVVAVEFDDYLFPFADADYQNGDTYGITYRGKQPVTFRALAGLIPARDGFVELTGGDVEPWGPLMNPGRESWDRSSRQRFIPYHGVQPSWLELDDSQLSPGRGSVFFAFKSLPKPPPEDEDDEPGEPPLVL